MSKKRSEILVWFGVAMLIAIGSTGCSLDSLLKSDQLPPDVSDPAITQTPEGARAAYNNVLLQFQMAFGGNNSNATNNFAAATGLLSDELQTSNRYGFPMVPTGFDQRNLPEGGTDADVVYSALQKTRGQASQAIGLLTDYLPGQTALTGRLYALQGYTEIFLAELFCSGVPLGTLDYHGDFTYRPGSNTEQVFTHAVALFDTALTLAADSVRFVQLAQIGRARALSGLGQYAAAAAAVATVPDDYRYNITYSDVSGSNTAARNFADAQSSGENKAFWAFTIPDREGLHGLDWRSSGDPRTATVVQHNPNDPTKVIFYPSKYDTLGGSPVVLASGVEARLIEAEAALQAGDVAGGLATLNHLRETAISPALADTTDSGTADGRVDLLFRERAFWLFLTGHRQGDLRRLVRQYGRTADAIYPIGGYPSQPFPYGADITAPVPAAEFANPLFTGCISRGA